MLLLFEERLLELERLPEDLLLPLRALGLLLLEDLLLLLPLEAEPRPLLLLREEPDLEEEEELRDAMACSFGRLNDGRRSLLAATLPNLGRPDAEPVGLHSASA